MSSEKQEKLYSDVATIKGILMAWFILMLLAIFGALVFAGIQQDNTAKQLQQYQEVIKQLSK